MGIGKVCRKELPLEWSEMVQKPFDQGVYAKAIHPQKETVIHCH